MCLNFVYISLYFLYERSFEYNLPNYVSIKLFSSTWFNLYLISFIQQDLDHMTFKGGIRGLLLTAVLFIVTVFYVMQPSDPRSNIESTLKVILICTFEAFVYSVFILIKTFRMLNLKIGMKN